MTANSSSDLTAQFNDLEAVKAAISIEQRGMEFYRLAAKNASSPGLKTVLQRFEQEEKNHLETFQKLEGQLLEKRGEEYLDSDEIGLYIAALLQTHIFNPDSAVMELLTRALTGKAVLEIAARAEKDTILLYEEAARLCRDPGGREVFQTLREEEKTHLREISEAIRKAG